MNLRKIICGVSAAALALSAMVIPASANYTVDDTTGAITWTFDNPTEAQPAAVNDVTGVSSSGTYYYTYKETLSERYDSDNAAQTAEAADSNMLEMAFATNSKNKSWSGQVGNGKFLALYPTTGIVYYTAPQDGIISVTSYTKNPKGYIKISGTDSSTVSTNDLVGSNENSQVITTYSCKSNERITIQSGYNSGETAAVYFYITEITFTPTYTVADTGVSDATVTVADGTTSAAVAGKTVTITPAANYEFTNAPTVVDASSNTVAVTENNGSYTFTMPKSDVTVTAAAEMITGNRGFTFDIKASEVSGKTLYVKVGTQPEASAEITTGTEFSGDGTVGIAFIISGIPQGMDVSARIE